MQVSYCYIPYIYNRTFSIENESIEIRKANSIVSQFNIDETCSIRFGVKWIKGFEFTIGRVYTIQLKNAYNKKLDIKLLSMYGIKKNESWDIYISILNSILDFLFDNYFVQHLENIKNNKETKICDTIVTTKGVQLTANTEIIPWKFIELAEFNRYFSITSTIQKNNYRMYYFVEDWDSYILMKVCAYIINEKLN